MKCNIIYGWFLEKLNTNIVKTENTTSYSNANIPRYVSLFIPASRSETYIIIYKENTENIKLI